MKMTCNINNQGIESVHRIEITKNDRQRKVVLEFSDNECKLNNELKFIIIKSFFGPGDFYQEKTSFYHIYSWLQRHQIHYLPQEY